MSSLRTRILIISSATVIGALALSGAATYVTVRANTMETIEQNLTAIAGANTLAIDKWVAAKAQAVKAAAEEVEHGDPQGFVKHLGNADGFPITTVGWTDKSFFSTSPGTPSMESLRSSSGSQKSSSTRRRMTSTRSRPLRVFRKT